MPTAQIEQKPPQTTYVFMATKAKELYLIVKPIRTLHHPDGTKEDIPGCHLQFKESRLDVTPELAAEFGEFFESAEEMAEALRKHKHYDTDFVELKVDAPAPDPMGAIERVVALGDDLDGLIRAYEDERSNYNRPPVIRTIAAAVKRLDGTELEVPDPVTEVPAAEPSGFEPIKPDPNLEVEKETGGAGWGALTKPL